MARTFLSRSAANRCLKPAGKLGTSSTMRSGHPDKTVQNSVIADCAVSSPTNVPCYLHRVNHCSKNRNGILAIDTKPYTYMN